VNGVDLETGLRPKRGELAHLPQVEYIETMGHSGIAAAEEAGHRIVVLDSDLAAALASFRRGFEAAGEAQIPALSLPAGISCAEAVEHLARRSRGEGLGPDEVPSTTRFLVMDGAVVGVYTVRHRLTPRLRECGGQVGYSVRPDARDRGYATLLLGAARRFAAGLGLDRLLITCDPRNIASRRVIEKHAGEVLDEYDLEGMGRGVRRYWLNTEG